MLAFVAALALSAVVPSVEYQVERQSSKEILLEGAAPIELSRLSKFEHEQSGNAVAMELTVRPTEADEKVTVELSLAERAQNGARHTWTVTMAVIRGVVSTSDLSWGAGGGWKIRLKVA